MVNKLRNSFRVLLHSFEKSFVFWNFKLDGCNRFHAKIGEGFVYIPYVWMSSANGLMFKQKGGWQFLP